MSEQQINQDDQQLYDEWSAACDRVRELESQTIIMQERIAQVKAEVETLKGAREIDLEKFADAYTRLEVNYDALREAQRWIPVSERLPKMNIEVITWDGDEIISDRLWEPDGGKIGFSLTGAGREVTHWMPLPAPPQEQSYE